MPDAPAKFPIPAIPDVSIVALHRTDLNFEPSLNAERSPRRIHHGMGRIAAQRALQALGLDQPGPIGRGPGGEPLWPPGTCGSITHSGEWAIAGAGDLKSVSSMGLDLERISRAINPGLAGRICLPAELVWIESDSSLSRERTLRIFSAKEAAYKALFPHVRRRLGFKEVELTWDRQACIFLAQFRPAIPSALPDGFRFEVGCQMHSGYILSHVVFKMN